jgi:TonB family protein
MTALLDVAVRSSLILALGLCAMPLLRRHSAALRHWVLFTCLMGAAVVPLAMRFMPAWEIFSVSSLVPTPLIERGVTPSIPATALRTPSELAPMDVSQAVTASADTWPALVVPLWMLGAGLSLVALMLGVLRLRHIDATAQPIVDGPWRAVALPDASVRVTDRRGLLVVWGVRRSTIIVPASALAWSRERIRAVLHHELAHVRRRDWQLLIAAEIVRAIYWFNPLVWLACARLRTEAEIACDDAVIANGAAGAEYAAHVVETARELHTQYWLPAPAIVRPSTLERRVRAMLDKNRNRAPLSTRTRRTAVALTLSLTLAVAAIAAQSFVSLSGTIVDPTNGVLPGVKLILVNEQTQQKYEIQTDRTGRYEFVGLPPGNYTMDATIPGFSRFTGRVVVGGQNLQQDLTMTVGTIQETITVRQDVGPPAPDPDRARRIAEFKAKRAATKCPESQPGGDVRMGGNIRVPLKLRDVRPLYPESLRGTEGLVVLNTKISTTGTVDEIDVESSTHPEFSQSAIDAVRQWEFDATLLNCEPIVTPMTVTVNFKTQ